jgi:hypothetical protein
MLNRSLGLGSTRDRALIKNICSRKTATIPSPLVSHLRELRYPSGSPANTRNLLTAGHLPAGGSART